MPCCRAAPAAAQSGGRLEYAVKFVCGTNARPSSSPAAAPGTYYTAINVHVPTGSITFAHLVSLAGPGRPGGHTPVIGTITLNFNDALDVDCAQIAAELTRGGVTPGPFFTGFFVIQSPSRDRRRRRLHRGGDAHGRRSSPWHRAGAGAAPRRLALPLSATPLCLIESYRQR